MTDEMIFAAALEKADPAARAAYLTEVCAGDTEQRRRLEELLTAHANAASFLERSPVGLHDPDTANTCSFGHEGGSTANDEVPLTFLQPATRADSQGRIGHYEVLEILGKGGFGIVFRAFDEQLQRVVAVKVLVPALAVTSPARKRFLREARSSAKVRHENVVQVYAVEEQPLPYLVMEFVPGETLQQRLDRTGPLEVPEAVRLGRQIAEGLAAAHSMGLIHRDIKPGNILIEASPQPRVKITDFGLARAADDASLSQSGIIAGTPMFMAPEQANGEPIDHRADLFSLGSVLYTMCSGRPPFRATGTLAVLKRVSEDAPRPIREIIPEVPQWLCDLIAKLHAKRPEDRFASAQEVADLLAQHFAQTQPSTPVKAAHQVAAPAVVKEVPSQEATNATVALRRSSFRAGRWAAAAAVLLPLGGLGFTEATGVTNVRGTVIRLFSPEGTLVVEVDDPGVIVKIDGSDIVITGAGAKEIRLKPGSYTVEARKGGKIVSRELVTVTKDGREVVRISQEAALPSEAKKIVVTSPQAKDVLITQQYVGQIHSQRHINVRALAKGYLQEISVKEGQAVKQGDVICKVVPTLYKAKYDAELAEVRVAEIELNNAKKLFEQKVASSQEMALHQAKLDKAVAKAKLAESELNFTIVRAPLDGLVDRLHEQQGSLIKERDILTTLSDNRAMWVYFNVPEARYFEYMASLGQDKEDPKIELVLANGSKFQHIGKMGAMEAKFNNVTGNIPFRADFPNPDGLLRHGQTGKVLIHRTLHKAIVIPQRATFEIVEKRYVYVVDKDGVVHQREIVIQNELDDIFVIKKGLDVDDRIVLKGVRQVRDGEKVKYEFRKP
jgi:RND family efflux transporter MFP subunit